MTTQQILKQYFGHDSFRPGQEELIDAVLQGRDALGIMPTGAGKSLCYQVPALMLPGITLVISPLISLMKDQVAALKLSGVPAAYLNSSLTPSQLELATQRACEGQYKIIYVAPERLEAPSFLRFAMNAPIALLAVDEAHCVSQWGQDFRPNYLRIADFLRSLPKRPPVGAYTATATSRVRDDIIRYLQLRDPVSAATGFDRPNLFFEVCQPKSKYEGLRAILLEKRGQTGIVYCATRKNVEEVAEKLRQEGISAGGYHAGMSDEERKRSQEDFQYDRINVMVATNAFGMGIDKSNVNFVIHYQMPKSMEAYYQQAGRAGRDGSPAECVMLYGGQDIITAKWLIQNSEPNGDLTEEEQRQVRRQDMDRLQTMIRYCTGDGCLRASILRYFGQTAPASCGACSRCVSGRYSHVNGMKRPTKAELAEREHITRKLPRAGQSLLVLQENDSSSGLFDALRQVRTEISRTLGVPAYVICDNKALTDMAMKRPRTHEQLLQVYGIGQQKAERFGDSFLKAIAEWERSQSGGTSAPAPREAAPRPSSGKKWSREETDMLRRGYLSGVSIAQLAAIHGTTEHLVRRRLKQLKLLMDMRNVERYGMASYAEDEEDSFDEDTGDDWSGAEE